MKSNDIYIKLLEILPQEKILRNELMSKHTSFKIGGNAEFFIKASTINEIKKIIQLSKNEKIPLYIIGNGSNILARDEGIQGIVLKIELNDLEIDKENCIITVGAGVKLGALAQKLLKEEITGLEFASGIPGTIGGAVRMNAGAHGKEMKDIICSTTYIDLNGNLNEINNEQSKFEYRNSIFAKEKYIIVQTKMKLTKGKTSKIKSLMNEYLEFRKEKQPIEYPSAGSTFKRGKDFITAKLIDECGLKGYRIGGAEISSKHAGFIVNTENATAQDVIELSEYAKKMVYEKFGKIIELEIEIF